MLRRLETELERNLAAPGGAGKVLAAHAGYDAALPARAGLCRPERRPSVRAWTAFDPRQPIYELVASIDAPAIDIARDIASTGPYLSMLMKVSDIAWFVRGYAGNDRRTTATLIAEDRAPDSARAGPPGACTWRDRSGRGSSSAWRRGRSDFLPALLKSVKEAERLYFVQYRALQEKVIAQLRAGQRVDISWIPVAGD